MDELKKIIRSIEGFLLAGITVIPSLFVAAGISRILIGLPIWAITLIGVLLFFLLPISLLFFFWSREKSIAFGILGGIIIFPVLIISWFIIVFFYSHSGVPPFILFLF